ncbi:MAG: DNA-formamidopyrimidine glycosylase family protein [Chloroflexota bacterium]
MPELPELEVVRDVLQRRVVGRTINDVQLIPPGGPIVARDLANIGFEGGLLGASIASVSRRGKFLVFAFQPGSQPLLLAINPKLTGRLQLAGSSEKRLAKTHLVLSLDDDQQLRYVDHKQMGQLYLTRDLASVPEYAGMGPEPFEISLEDFRARLRPLRGEIKGILTRGEFVAGIGNAYADEILWAARLHPYRKRTQLAPADVDRLYEAMRLTLAEAVVQVRNEMQEQIHLKPRDFLAVHMRTGQPCPRCGAPISLVGANQCITNFCRSCQPGGLIKGM